MPNIAFFDFDGTITHSETFSRFVLQTASKRRLVKGKLVIMPYYVGYKLGIISGAKVRHKVLKIGLTGIPEAEIRHKGRQYSAKHIPKVLRQNAMQQIEWHQRQGDKIVIVSASMDVYLKPWCDRHGFELLCSEVEYKNGVVTGNYINQDCSGERKKQRILQNYDLKRYAKVYVYGDTKEDFAMLSLGTEKIYQWKAFK